MSLKRTVSCVSALVLLASCGAKEPQPSSGRPVEVPDAAAEAAKAPATPPLPDAGPAAQATAAVEPPVEAPPEAPPAAVPPPPPPPLVTATPTGPVLPCWDLNIWLGVSACELPSLCAAFYDVSPALAACFQTVKNDARLHVRMTLPLRVEPGKGGASLELTDELRALPLGRCLSEAFGRFGPLRPKVGATCEVTVDPLADASRYVTEGDSEQARLKLVSAERARLQAITAKEAAAKAKVEEAARRAEEARRAREEAREEAARRAEEARERREEAAAEARARRCERCQAGIEACEERVRRQQDRLAESRPLNCDGFLDCFAEGIADGAVDAIGAMDHCARQCDRVCD
jgi:hypothetical protein